MASEKKKREPYTSMAHYPRPRCKCGSPHLQILSTAGGKWQGMVTRRVRCEECGQKTIMYFE